MSALAKRSRSAGVVWNSYWASVTSVADCNELRIIKQNAQLGVD